MSLMTYHSAKGLEWPVVILSGLNSDRVPNMWSPVVIGGGQADDPLHGRTLRSWTWPFGKTDGEFPKTPFGKRTRRRRAHPPKDKRRGREAEENLRLLYVGAPGPKRTRFRASRPEVRVAPPAPVRRLPSRPTAWRRRTRTQRNRHNARYSSPEAQQDPVPRQTPAQERWLSLTQDPSPPECIPRYHSPSRQTEGDADGVRGTTELPGPSHFPSGATEDQYAAIGDAVHSYLAALPSTRLWRRKGCRTLPCGVLRDGVLRRRCSFRQESDSATECTRHPDARWHTEVAMTAARSAGGQWFGTGLLLQLPDGDVVIIDHKSAPIRREHCRAKAATFASQIRVTCEVATTCGERSDPAFIHFPVAVTAEMQTV